MTQTAHRWTPEEEAAHRRYIAERAAEEHQDAIAYLSRLDRDIVRAAVHACRTRGVLTHDPLPADMTRWTAYHAGIVRAAVEYHSGRGEAASMLAEWRASKTAG